MSAPTLEDFAAALAGAVEAGLRENPPRSDLADVLARARAIDAAAIPPGILATIGEAEHAEEHDRPDPGLASFAAAMRVQVERSVRDRELAAVPVPRRPLRRRPIATAAVLAVAAVALLGWGWSRLGSTVLDPDGARDPMGAAGAAIDTDDGARPYHDRRDDSSKHAPALEPEAHEPAATESIEPELESAPAPAPATVDRAKAAPSLDELEARARERWAAGDLDGADALFRRVVRRAAKSSRAELAYGDLFAIAKQRGGRDALAGVWREYLRKFPHGRYADDARAGLCRRASDQAQAECWEDYLHEHPRGAHAAEALRLRSTTGAQ